MRLDVYISGPGYLEKGRSRLLRWWTKMRNLIRTPKRRPHSSPIRKKRPRKKALYAKRRVTRGRNCLQGLVPLRLMCLGCPLGLCLRPLCLCLGRPLRPRLRLLCLCLGRPLPMRTRRPSHRTSSLRHNDIETSDEEKI